MRSVKIVRKTFETQVELELNLDGTGIAAIATGVGFLDHMLTLLAKHGFVDLQMKALGDLQVDSHHTVEDCGIVLGQAIKKALGNKEGIHRYGSCLLPMDEALAQVALDFSGRPFLAWKADIPRVMLGNMEAEMVEEFFRALAMESGLTLHIRVLEGKNTHHIVEAIFKAFARAFADAIASDNRVKGVMSSKGSL
ncbi:MAG: imidazoleglycerol-phosphate dehydratase HisB [Acidaminococcaceae bacterium]|nr:imidazoleglycerol-phosphate dehydratase HisB [Acidaminococcaceae bacterium]MDD4722815.1 imidazoleglycerol-phosphate dehydratase HisB [Acidaminococcaceae bacterium]